MTQEFAINEPVVLIAVGGIEGLRRQREPCKALALAITLYLQERDEHLTYLCPDHERVEEVLRMFHNSMSDLAAGVIRRVARGISELPELNTGEELVVLHGRAADYMGGMMLYNAQEAEELTTAS